MSEDVVTVCITHKKYGKFKIGMELPDDREGFNYISIIAEMALDQLFDAIEADESKPDQIFQPARKPDWAVGETKYYWITDNAVVCCDDHASVYQCKACEDIVECEFHNDINQPHCEEQRVQTI